MNYIVLYVHMIVALILLLVTRINKKKIDVKNIEIILYIVGLIWLSFMLMFSWHFIQLENNGLVLLLFYLFCIIFGCYVFIDLLLYKKEMKKNE